MLDIRPLAESVQSLYGKGISANTSRTYASGKRRYLNFCNAAGLTPLPLSENTLCLFVAYLSTHNLQHASIRNYLSSLRHLQISAGFPDPFTSSTCPRLTYVLRGIQRSTTQTARPRLPITPDILNLLLETWAQQSLSYETRLLWAACCLGFFGFMRIGECTSQSPSNPDSAIVAITDISREGKNPPSYLSVHLRKSKTDPFGSGIKIFLGSTGQRICPVAAILSFLMVRPSSMQGPLLRYPDGSTLTRDRLVREVRKVLSLHGFNPAHYNGHSFRIGAATAAAASGIPDHVIKMLGRWQSTAYTLYIRTPGSQLPTTLNAL